MIDPKSTAHASAPDRDSALNVCLNKMTTSGQESDGLSPDLWGAPLWKTIHFIAAGFPARPTPHDRDHFRAFIAQLPHVLPCDECKQHSVRLLAQLPPSVDSRDRLFDWSVEFHNRVNDRIGAPRIALNEARAAYGMPLPPPPPSPPAVVTPVPRQAPITLAPKATVPSAPRVQVETPAARVVPRYVPPRHMGYNPSTMGHNQSRQFYSRPAAMTAPAPQALPPPPQARAAPVVNRQISAVGLPLPPGMPRAPAPTANPLPSTNRTPGRSKCNCGKK